MLRRKTLKVVAGLTLSFTGLAGAIIVLSKMEIISVAMAKLMLVALLALCLGFGFLIAVYRLISKLP